MLRIADPHNDPAPTDESRDERAFRWPLRDIGACSQTVWQETALRPYQLGPARAIVHSALAGDGASFAVVFARQAGKDELLAQVIAFLLIRRQRLGGEIVVAAPSLVPQGQITLRRIADRLASAALFAPEVEIEGGHIIRVGRAAVRFVSAGPMAQARGATASLLLVANEAQDIEPERWDAVFDPMGASTDATTVFAGTVWTRNTLLARQMTSARGRGMRSDRPPHVFSSGLARGGARGAGVRGAGAAADGGVGRGASVHPHGILPPTAR